MRVEALPPVRPEFVGGQQGWFDKLTTNGLAQSPRAAWQA